MAELEGTFTLGYPPTLNVLQWFISGVHGVVQTSSYYYTASIPGPLNLRTADPVDVGTTNLTGTPVTTHSGSTIVYAKPEDWSSADFRLSVSYLTTVGGMPAVETKEADVSFNSYIQTADFRWKVR